MVVGRITHYAFDLALISTVLAGIKRNTGYSVKLQELPEGAPRSFASSYLQAGEKIFDYVSAYSHTSGYFHRDAAEGPGKASWGWGSK
ncbi:hypothetical protein PGT21_015975 [Puccinia graminis f. sp. tritici]|uniref:DUF1748-domain-containing protein n=2 Tax=Puccinia graminis f. sp. tritici TaxID=56615 RepID=E3KXT8_PUCGT|nr:uncharacterized protein PGTG_14991 [Puccinia graminis f. sp. tritici CRL 75-36-700-3]KAA1065938.1 hypothetical protein PGT21_016118 [Puccinia graminis f. sp. tritici]EFP89150.1 hypothetical protein PGTG_14991 [Puccinia graminis f. sp. tritici CRL 75-36-700-3]KAA1078684.1 hypothetical protein PGTUg99_014026 [Puccinia graminis f. sp. tritici]KAA1103370.1 hypothetical protein PGT21_015975 [Puccinia graminis f. sp. tritici]KAA1130528.1 hypothetical protein PGTUg99_016649 [Puccinia graminis f. s